MKLTDYLKNHSQTATAKKSGLTPSGISKAQHRNVFVVPIGDKVALYELKRIDLNDTECNIDCKIKKAKP